jgi:hypothetical protein
MQVPAAAPLVEGGKQAPSPAGPNPNVAQALNPPQKVRDTHVIKN